jgi:hypothetical protein
MQSYIVCELEKRMRNEMALDILILLIVVFLIWQKLWKSLGSDAHNVHRVKLSRESAEKLYNILKNEAEKGLKNKLFLI